jgi:DNA polymerase-3 subunit epsilon
MSDESRDDQADYRRDRDRQTELFQAEREPAGELTKDRSRIAEELEANRAVDPFGGVPGATPLYNLPLIALDFETTGLAVERGDTICEIGLVSGRGDKIEVLFSELIDPGRPLSPPTRTITGLDDHDLAGKPQFQEIVSQVRSIIGSTPLVMHNAPFDLHLLLKEVDVSGLPAVENLAIDTLLMARFVGRNREGNSLRKTAEYYGIEFARTHRAADDAMMTARVFHALVPYLEHRGVRTVGDLVRGRMGGSARLFELRVSSVLLDLVTRSAEEERVVTIVYARQPGARILVRRVRARSVEGERYLIGWDLELDAERTFRLDRILSLDDGNTTYFGPWAIPEEFPTREV